MRGNLRRYGEIFVKSKSDKNTASNVVSIDEKLKVEVESLGMELVDEDDDSVITVMSPVKGASVNAGENVMSDKVVHAMLDEAKLVCVS